MFTLGAVPMKVRYSCPLQYVNSGLGIVLFEIVILLKMSFSDISYMPMLMSVLPWPFHVSQIWGPGPGTIANPGPASELSLRSAAVLNVRSFGVETTSLLMETTSL